MNFVCEDLAQKRRVQIVDTRPTNKIIAVVSSVCVYLLGIFSFVYLVPILIGSKRTLSTFTLL